MASLVLTAKQCIYQPQVAVLPLDNQFLLRLVMGTGTLVG
jgi:hypothetical protein